MYKTLNIGGKDYKIEYTMEAALCNECVESVTGLLMEMGIASSEKDLKQILKNMANLPHVTLTMFYAGLLEYHGDHPTGDRSIKTLSDAKALIKQYMAENKDSDEGNFYGLMGILFEQMAEDGFFKQIGLEQMVNNAETESKAKKPQDHKKKAITTYAK